VPAYFVKPKNLTGKAPTVLYHHSHSGDYKRGKDEFIYGRNTIANPPYAEFLTATGLLRVVCGHVGIRRACHEERTRYVQAHAVARASDVGHDGVRFAACDGLSAHETRSRHQPDRYRRAFDGKHDGMVARRAGHAREGYGRYLLFDRLSGADRSR
jgi:hypothetical protein